MPRVSLAFDDYTKNVRSSDNLSALMPVFPMQSGRRHRSSATAKGEETVMSDFARFPTRR
jgi:hypothetical protein